MTSLGRPRPRRDAPTEPPRRVVLLGYTIDGVTMDQAVEACRNFLDGDRRPRLVLTVNAATLAMAEADPALAEVLHAGDLVLADGVPVVWASRLLGAGLPCRVAGVDLMGRLIERADRDGLRVYFLGALPEVVGRVVRRVGLDHPGLVVAGHRDGYFHPEDWPTVVAAIRASRADLLFVALPTPLKEVWCRAHLDALGVPVVLPVGGAFDVFSGLISRAPGWMQRSGLEWFWRFLMEPWSKGRRYLRCNTALVRLCLVAFLQQRKRRLSSAP